MTVQQSDISNNKQQCPLTPTPLELDGWIEFNEAKWSMRAQRLKFQNGNKELPSLHAVVYKNRHGQLKCPPLNPYLPIRFCPTPTQSRYRLNQQWLELSGQFADYCLTQGENAILVFPPDILDAREFTWRSYHSYIRYSYWIELPVDYDKVDSSVRTRIRKAKELSFYVERVKRFDHVIECLNATGIRKGFSYGLSVKDLAHANQLIGEESFRCYVCYTSDGNPASARIVLHSPGHHALDLVAGTKTEFLNSGAAQLNTAYVLDDLMHAGASGFDYVGANIRSVAAAKASWGGILTPYVVVRQPGWRELAMSFRSYMINIRNKRHIMLSKTNLL